MYALDCGRLWDSWRINRLIGRSLVLYRCHIRVSGSLGKAATGELYWKPPGGCLGERSDIWRLLSL